MSLYADYITEKTNDHVLEWDKGFATYRYMDAHTVYIVEIYVVPEARKLGIASQLADRIVEEAKRTGRKFLMGSVVPSAKDSTTSLKVLIGYGMSLFSSTNDMIFFKKEI